MHHTSVGGRLRAAAATNPAVPDFSMKAMQETEQLPCRIQMFGWQRKPLTAKNTSHNRILGSRPKEARLVNDDTTRATTASSESTVSTDGKSTPTGKSLQHEGQDVFFYGLDTDESSDANDAVEES